MSDRGRSDASTGRRGPVVVGVDGSAEALDAVSWAADVAGRQGLELTVLTAVAPTVHVAATIDAPPGSSASALLDRARDVAADRLGDARVHVSAVTDHGTPAGVLVDHSESASLVVVGTRGLGEFTGGLSGSVSTAVATHARCAVAVVPAGSSRADGPVVVGVDGTANSMPALRFAFAAAAARGLRLVAVHAWSDIDVPQPDGADGGPHTEVGEQATLAESLAGFAEDNPTVEVDRVVVRDRPVRELVARSADASMVVVGRRGRGGFRSLLLGSTSRAVLHSVDVPVVVVPGDTSPTAARDETA
ncbi:universal stress protein [Rhodococcoides corynebacterioides]|uniref:Universal stress protein n=1 Tax=Rhodococcoides corynebacterioides TaxID=53972 RepID=A0ABS7PAD9_9NOCA|nr:universal stress protein [Rhodococcus corynebacterioides]MBY6368559.1 universal stress protein [Rhodococcus corynebacterioides]MBY6409472.1 universal stress protein [Rhodococcus corynebacterioides]